MKMKKLILASTLITSMFITASCGQQQGQSTLYPSQNQQQQQDQLPELENRMVVFSGWGGSVDVNDWIQNELAVYAADRYDIDARWMPMDIDEILLKLNNEKAANAEGTIDVVWINGENFYFAKENGLLYGPFLSDLENSIFIDMNDPTNIEDFGYPTEGYESPWGRSQFVIIYDSEHIHNTIINSQQLLEFAKENPGRFTYPEATDFMGSAFLRTVLYDIVGYDVLKELNADKAEIEEAISEGIDFLLEIKPYLWRQGQTYPSSSSQLDTLYQDGEVWMTMKYNPQAAYSSVLEGSWPDTTRTSVWENGTPSNTHFVAIPFNAPNKEGALKLIDATLSPEMQLSKADLNGWGDSPVLDYDRLTPEFQQQWDALSNMSDVPEGVLLSPDLLTEAARPELSAPVTVILEEIWRERILLGN